MKWQAGSHDPLKVHALVKNYCRCTRNRTKGGNRLDIYFESRKEAFEFGVQSVIIFVKEKE